MLLVIVVVCRELLLKIELFRVFIDWINGFPCRIDFEFENFHSIFICQSCIFRLRIEGQRRANNSIAILSRSIRFHLTTFTKTPKMTKAKYLYYINPFAFFLLHYNSINDFDVLMKKIEQIY